MAKFKRTDVMEPEPTHNALPEISESGSHSAARMAAGEPDRERVERRAYELYLARGAADGQAMDDWLHAERELIEAREPYRE